jgi:NAD(P)-dependent dehydrogenase (short-subunit alcohol dehydrogenase family)
MPALNELFDLSGRVAIVTGGSRGLGQEMAEGLAEAGAALFLCARREEWLTPAVAALRARGFAVDGASPTWPSRIRFKPLSIGRWRFTADSTSW